MESNNLNTQLYQNIEGKISISLDAWTSPNNIAFLGIVAHFTNNAGELGALKKIRLARYTYHQNFRGIIN